MKSWKAVFRLESEINSNMARLNKKMSLIKGNGLVPARKRFKITFGKALQNAPGRTLSSAGSQPKPANRIASRPVQPVLPVSTAAHDDHLAKAAENLAAIKS